MPRFKDENDFPDVEIPVVDRRSISNEVVRSFYKTGVPSLVNEPEAGSARRFYSDAQEANRLPSPKADGSDDSESDFVEVPRSTDNRRTFNRSSKAWPSTLWGSSARTSVNNAWLPVFRNPSEVVPCIERQVRREVLFAKRKAGGAGSRRRKRRTYWSQFGC